MTFGIIMSLQNVYVSHKKSITFHYLSDVEINSLWYAIVNGTCSRNDIYVDIFLFGTNILLTNKKQELNEAKLLVRLKISLRQTPQNSKFYQDIK